MKFAVPGLLLLLAAKPSGQAVVQVSTRGDAGRLDDGAVGATAEREYFQMVNDFESVADRSADFTLTSDRRSVVECGGVYKRLQSEIRSPAFPSDYQANLHCEYTFKSPFVCSSQYHFQFLEFSLEPSRNCSKDRVAIGEDEVLCGTVIGSKLYDAPGGLLRMKFVTDGWGSGRGFRILVTRQPCSDDNEAAESSTAYSVFTTIQVADESESDDEDTTTEPNVAGDGKIVSSRQDIPPEFNPGGNGYLPPPMPPTPQNPLCPTTPCVPGQHVPQYPQYPQYPPYQPGYPTSTTGTEGTNSLGGPPPGYAPVKTESKPEFPEPTTERVEPENQIAFVPGLGPTCCRNVFNQRRFYLASANFPSETTINQDCVVQIQRSSPYTCRLVIGFKFFLHGNDQLPGCPGGFVEIDGQRICGCRTGQVYRTAEFGPYATKTIRIHSQAGRFPTVRGFLLDVYQEDCPQRYPLKRSDGSDRERFVQQQHQQQQQVPSNGRYSYEMTRVEGRQLAVPVRTTQTTNTTTQHITHQYYFFSPDEAEPVVRPQEVPFVAGESQHSEKFVQPSALLPEGPNRCHFSALDWVRLKFDWLWIFKPPRKRMFVKMAFAGRFRLQKLTVFWWLPIRFSCSPTSSLNTSSRLGTHRYRASAS
uniref:CUB domain-containing protein n=1 Tax=Anopheles dirus TaxID=7168 RepID=A0A182MZ26_9DIPT